MATQHSYPIVTKTVPTFYFVGVTTGKSSIMKVFPRWMEALGRADVIIEGIDHKIHDQPETYRRTVAQMKYDPLSLGALVTTHKIDLLSAAGDMFDELHESARLTGEVSSISKRGNELWGHAKDPLTSGLSMDVFLGDGYFGWQAHAPFDAIVVTAAASHVPPPLIEQLKPGGRMIIPVGARFMTQQLLLIEKSADGEIITRQIAAVRFVPLTGEH